MKGGAGNARLLHVLISTFSSIMISTIVGHAQVEHINTKKAIIMVSAKTTCTYASLISSLITGGCTIGDSYDTAAELNTHSINLVRLHIMWNGCITLTVTYLATWPPVIVLPGVEYILCDISTILAKRHISRATSCKDQQLAILLRPETLKIYKK